MEKAKYNNDEIVQINSRFLGVKKIPDIGFDLWMNLATKIVVGTVEKKSITSIWKFCIKLISSFVYFKKAKCANNEIMQIDFW